jgi:hypothetical protein
VCSRTNIASCILPPLFSSFFSFSKIHKCNHQRITTKSMYDAIIECSFSSYDWINERICKEKKKKKKGTYRSSATQGCIIYVPMYAITLNICSNWSLSFSIGYYFQFENSAFFFFSFILLYTLTSIIYAIFLLFLSCKLLFKHTFTYIYRWRNNPERTLNCNVGGRDTI